MTLETIRKIEETIEQAKNLSDDKKQALKEMITTLRSEIQVLSEANSEQAKSIVSFTEISTHEATRTKTNPDTLFIIS